MENLQERVYMLENKEGDREALERMCCEVWALTPIKNHDDFLTLDQNLATNEIVSDCDRKRLVRTRCFRYFNFKNFNLVSFCTWYLCGTYQVLSLF